MDRLTIRQRGADTPFATHRTKQFYMFIQKEWIEGDPGQPPPPPERKFIRNREWKHMHVEDILSMPDKWEYPFFAIWDSVRSAWYLGLGLGRSE